MSDRSENNKITVIDTFEIAFISLVDTTRMWNLYYFLVIEVSFHAEFRLSGFGRYTFNSIEGIRLMISRVRLLKWGYTRICCLFNRIHGMPDSFYLIFNS